MLIKANMFYWLFLWRGTEVVVTGLTRNQFEVFCLTWVRIPLSLPIAVDQKVVNLLPYFFRDIAKKR